MFFFKKKKDISLEVEDPWAQEGHCFISGNLRVAGEVYFAGNLRIDGRVDGRIGVFDGKRGTLVVSKGAVVNGPVFVTDLITDGTINGEVFVEDKLECRSNAIIKGEVRYRSMNISEGARIEGRCIQRDQEQKKADSHTTPFLATRDITYLKKKA